jgi:ABC-type lipoprotein export system ATPase subunit
MDEVLRAEGLVRRYGDLEVVRSVSLGVSQCEAVALLGPSGSGKTTLLHMLGLLERPTSGRVLLGGADVWATRDAVRSRLRLRHVGFVFQEHNLVDHLSSVENAALPAWRLTGSKKAAFAAADALLERLGLAARRNTLARVLSRGEAQRVAVARALINRPVIVLADEPTGSLDSVSARAVHAAFADMRALGAALVLVTHNPALAETADRVLRLHDGLLGEESPEI